MLQDDPRVTGEYFCVADRVETDTGPRDEMTMMVEVAGPGVDRDTVRRAVEERLRVAIGVRVAVQIVGPRELAPLTGHGTRAKLKRFEDRRKGREGARGGVP